MVLLLAISFFALNLPEQFTVIAASEPDTSKQVELKWFVIGNDQQADTIMVEKAVNKYLKDKINATLKLTTVSWGDFEDEMAVKVASGEEYDITFTASWAINYRDYSEMGAFVDVTDMMDTYAPKTKALLGESILKSAEVDGRLYVIPVYHSEIVNDYGILLNKKLVKKYKVDTSKIKKLEDLEATFKKIKAKEPKIINFYPFDEYGSYGIYNILNYDKLVDSKTPGAVLRDGKSTKVINDFDTADAKSLFNLMNKWYKSGYINKSTKANDYTFFENNNSNIFAFYSKLYLNKCEGLLQNRKLDLVPVSLTKPTLSTNGSMQAISSTSKNPERALMFLELVNTDEKLSNMLNYGIEGVHYKKTGANNISQLSPRYEKYNPSSSWMFGNQSITYSLPGYSALSENKLKEYVNKAVVSPLLGFSFVSEPVSSQISNLNKVTNKYLTDLCIGKVNPSVYLPKMNKELKNAGLQEVLDEMQSQVNEFVEGR